MNILSRRPIAYYNEIDPFCVEWLRKLMAKGRITKGDIDDRPIQEVQPEEVAGYHRVHFFAGIGGWERALSLAGWPDDWPVWTGSCPCQPFSSAGKGKGGADDRHLWPEWFRLIRQSRPPTLFGEQVASAIGHGWLDLVSADLEGEGYACGSAVLGAHSVGAPHIRQRLWFVAESESHGSLREPRKVDGEASGQERGDMHEPFGSGGISGFMADTDVTQINSTDPGRLLQKSPGSSEYDLLGHGIESGLEGFSGDGDGSHQSGRNVPEENGPASEASASFWSSCEWIGCRDGKARPVESVPFPLVDGIPEGLGLVCVGDRAILHPLVKETKNRVGRLKGYGNAIVPQVGGAFIRAFMEWEEK